MGMTTTGPCGSVAPVFFPRFQIASVAASAARAIDTPPGVKGGAVYGSFPARRKCGQRSGAHSPATLGFESRNLAAASACCLREMHSSAFAAMVPR